jgi:hypothetical protein
MTGSVGTGSREENASKQKSSPMGEIHDGINTHAPLLQRAGPIFTKFPHGLIPDRTYVAGSHDATPEFRANTPNGGESGLFHAD